MTLFQAVLTRRPFRRVSWNLPERGPGFDWVTVNAEHGDLEYLQGSVWGPLSSEDTLAEDYEVFSETTVLEGE